MLNDAVACRLESCEDNSWNGLDGLFLNIRLIAYYFPYDSDTICDIIVEFESY